VTNLVTGNTWVCDLETSIKIQGAFYAYSDGFSCSVPTNLCSASAGCCISGTMVADPSYEKWGCGMGLELNRSSGDTGVKSAYTGPVKCFNITLTGSAPANTLRVAFTQTANPGTGTGTISPFVEIPVFTNGWTGQVCFTDVTCPTWAISDGSCAKPTGSAGTPYDLQFQISQGGTASTAGPFNVCVTKIQPI
jgi:hypothetical protein